MARRRSRNTTTAPTEAPSRAPAVPPGEPPAARPARLRTGLLVGGVVGLGLCIAIGDRNGWTVAQLIALAAALLIALVPASRRGVVSALERLRHLDRSGIRSATLLCFVIALLYMLGTAYVQGRDLIPLWHDHQMTLLQAAMLAHGKLWLPQHPCADFFETFYVFVKPV
jgi:hypothetical protein